MVVWTAWWSVVKTVCTAYSGLVPMSPKTTPSAPSASAAAPDLAASSAREIGSASVLAGADRAAADTLQTLAAPVPGAFV